MKTVKSIKNTAQGSKHIMCWKSTKKGPGPGLGWIWDSFLRSSWRQMCFCVEQISAKKESEKRYPQTWNNWLWAGPRAPGQPPLKSKIVWVINNNWTRNFNNSTKTPTIAESLLQFDCCCVCFLFDFISSTVVVFVSCLIPNLKWWCFCFLFDFKSKAHDLTRPELRLGEFPGIPD